MEVVLVFLLLDVFDVGDGGQMICEISEFVVFLVCVCVLEEVVGDVVVVVVVQVVIFGSEFGGFYFVDVDIIV